MFNLPVLESVDISGINSHFPTKTSRTNLRESLLGHCVTMSTAEPRPDVRLLGPSGGALPGLLQLVVSRQAVLQ